MLRLSAIIATLLFISSSWATAAELQPFGIAPGRPLASLEVIGRSDDGFYNIKPPTPQVDFGKYAVLASPKIGVCLVRGESQKIFTSNSPIDRDGVVIKYALSQIADKLFLKYGRVILTDTSEGVSKFAKDKKWLDEIEAKSRVFGYFWDIESGTDLPKGLNAISLFAAKRPDDKQPWIAIQYNFSNVDQCFEEIFSIEDAQKSKDAAPF